MSQNFWYPPTLGGGSVSVTANQGTPNNDTNAWPVRITDGTHDALVSAGGALSVADAPMAAKTGSSDVVVAYDYRAFTYVAATQKIDTIVYKTGGSGGTTVATQTFGYDGSDRLTSITKT